MWWSDHKANSAIAREQLWTCYEHPGRLELLFGLPTTRVTSWLMLFLRNGISTNLKRGETRVSIDTEPEVVPNPSLPRSRQKSAMGAATAKEPVIEVIEVIEPPYQPVKTRKHRKKAEPGPPKGVAFNSARGQVSFTAHKASDPPPNRPYENLHGSNRFSHIMSAW